MEKILINNIGNRHILLKDKDGLVEIDKKDFKNITKNILEDWDNQKKKVSLNILSQYLDKLKKEELPKKIVLFATDQDNKFSNQDTIYAAYIVEKVLKEKYNIPDVLVNIIEQNPTDENELINTYKYKLNGLLNSDSNKKWIFLDAGGTPQQKMVCKLLLTEINSGNLQIDYLNKVQGNETNELTEKKYDALETFFILKNIKKLIEKGHYVSALQLLTSNEGTKKNKSLNLIELGKFRLLGIYNKNISFNKYEKKLKCVNNFENKISYINLDELFNTLDPNDYFNYGEFICRSDFYLQNEQYPLFILTFQQSLESLLIDLLLYFAIAEGIKLEGRNDNDKIDNFLKSLGYDYTNIPTRIDLTLKLSKKYNLFEINELIELYASIINGYQTHYKKKKIIGLDDLRNSYVHRGKDINKDKAQPIIEVFSKIKDLLLMKTNGYNELNAKIQERLFL